MTRSNAPNASGVSRSPMCWLMKTLRAHRQRDRVLEVRAHAEHRRCVDVVGAAGRADRAGTFRAIGSGA